MKKKINKIAKFYGKVKIVSVCQSKVVNFKLLLVGSHQQRVTYTGDELEYIYFVHALNIVGRILTYKQGTKLFPVKVKGYDGM